MSRTFNIPKKPYDNAILYKKKEITIEPGVTVFAGCNGAGKTTLLLEIKEQLRRAKIPCFSFDNRTEGGSSSVSKAGFYGHMDLLAALVVSSEGEQIMTNLGEQVAAIGGFMRKHGGAEEVWILLDAVDSGFSIDNIVELKELFFKTILEDSHGRDIYIVCTANSYEMCNGESCFDVYKGEYINFKDYEEYRAFILASRKQKDKRYKS
jgi:predicted ATPase